MANFVEQATLEVIDKSSPKIKKINSSISQLMRTVRGFRGKQLDIGIKGNPVGRLRKVSSEISALRRKAASPIAVRTQVQQIPATVGRPLGRPGAIMDVPQRRGFGGAFPPPEGYGRSMGDAFLRSVQFRLAAAIENAITNGFSQGLKSRDVADTRFSEFGLQGRDREDANRRISDLAGDFRIISRGDIANLFSESLGVSRGNQDVAEGLTRELLEQIEVQVARGNDVDKATDSVIQLGKTAEMTGRLFDNQGNVIKGSLNDFNGLMTSIGTVIGKEMTPQFVSTIVKATGSAKAGLNDRGLRVLLLDAEERGPRAGTGTFQLTKQLQGFNVTKEDLAFQAELGLIKTKQVDIGTTGGKKSTRTVVDSSIDADLLTSDPLGFVEKFIIPKMVERGFDPNKTSDAQVFSNKLVGRKEAVDTLTSLITRSSEFASQEAAIKRLQDKNIDRDAIESDSSLIGFTELASQFKSALGEAANSLEGVFLPAIKVTSEGLGQISDFFAGSTGEGDAAAVVKTGSAAVGGAALLTVAAKKLFNMTPMNQAAAQHMTAARMLQGAATSLGGPGVGGAGGGGNRRGGRRGRGSLAGRTATALAIPALAEFGQEIGTMAGEAFGVYVLGRTEAEQASITERSQRASENNAKIMMDAVKSVFSSRNGEAHANEFGTQTPSDTKAVVEQVKAEGLDAIRSILSEIKNKSLTNPNSPTLQQEAAQGIQEARSIAADIGLNNDEMALLNTQANTIQQAFGLSTVQADNASNKMNGASQQAGAVASQIQATPPLLSESIVNGARQAAPLLSEAISNAVASVKVSAAQPQPDLGATSLASE